MPPLEHYVSSSTRVEHIGNVYMKWDIGYGLGDENNMYPPYGR